MNGDVIANLQSYKWRGGIIFVIPSPKVYGGVGCSTTLKETPNFHEHGRTFIFFSFPNHVFLTMLILTPNVAPNLDITFVITKKTLDCRQAYD